jgi:hypothetical protein
MPCDCDCGKTKPEPADQTAEAALLALLRNAVHIRGGNVQTVLGR